MGANVYALKIMHRNAAVAVQHMLQVSRNVADQASRICCGCPLSTHLEGLREPANTLSKRILSRRSFCSIVDRRRRIDDPSEEASARWMQRAHKEGALWSQKDTVRIFGLERLGVPSFSITNAV